MIRTITDHQAVHDLNDRIAIRVLDEKGIDGGNHVYELNYETTAKDPVLKVVVKQVLEFQKGPVKEVGHNGISNEALIAIVIDRLRGFQSGPFSTRENALALTHLEEGLMWLEKRSRDRIERGVVGTLNT